MENVTNVINEKRFNSSKLVLDNRKKLSLTGVEKAISSNEQNMIFMVSGSRVYICGQGLHIEKLDVESGMLELSGEVDSIKFGAGGNKNMLKRLFKWYKQNYFSYF